MIYHHDASYDPFSDKIRFKTQFHRLWRYIQHRRWLKDCKRRGVTPNGAYDEGMWMESQEIKAKRRKLDIRFSVEPMSDFRE